MSKKGLKANTGTDDDHEAAAEIFGQSLDPLAKYEDNWRQFEETTGTNAFEMFMSDRKADLSEKTKNLYWTAFDQWREFMAAVHDRHPCCPSERMVREWVEWLVTEKGNEITTTEEKVRKLRSVFKYVRQKDSWPNEYEKVSPVKSAKEDMDFSPEREKSEYPNITVEEHREIIGSIDHILEKTVIATMLKFGLRVGEASNIKLQDVHLSGANLKDHYPEMGTNDGLDGHENAVYIPSKFERDGNKSKQSRILPLDEELRHLWRKYLLIRPSNPDGWLFLSKSGHKKLEGKSMNRGIWKKHYRPRYEFPDDPQTNDLSSHYGRHFFTSFWKHRADNPMPREWVQWMRGDVIDTSEDSSGSEAPTSVGSDAVDVYVNVDYTDIEQHYRNNIFKLRL